MVDRIVLLGKGMTMVDRLVSMAMIAGMATQSL